MRTGGGIEACNCDAEGVGSPDGLVSGAVIRTKLLATESTKQFMLLQLQHFLMLLNNNTNPAILYGITLGTFSKTL